MVVVDAVHLRWAVLQLQRPLPQQMAVHQAGQQPLHLFQRQARLLGQGGGGVVAEFFVIKKEQQLQAPLLGQHGEQLPVVIVSGEVDLVALRRLGQQQVQGEILGDDTQNHPLLRNILGAEPGEGTIRRNAAHIAGLRHSLLPFAEQQGVGVHIYGQQMGAQQAEDLHHPVILGDGLEPLAKLPVHILWGVPVPSEQGVDGYPQPVGDGRQQGYVRCAAALPAAHRLGADPHGPPQLLLGHPCRLPVPRDLSAQQRLAHVVSSFINYYLYYTSITACIQPTLSWKNSSVH